MSLDAEGYLTIDPETPQMLRMFLEDLGCSLSACDKVLDAIADVRSGRRLEYRTTTDFVHLLVTKHSASFTIAAKLTRIEPVPFTVDEVEDGVRRLRDFTESLPEDQR